MISTLVSASCWARIVAELDRVYPDEAVAAPLCALVYRDPLRDPCAPIHLADLRQVVIPRVVLVPADRQHNSPTRVRVLEGADDRVNAELLELTRRHPRLRACAALHSHPFATGGTSPSRGICGDLGGHMQPLLERNREAGLEACFSFIACRGAGSWRLQTFALDERGELHDLGFAQVIDDETPLLRPLLLSPLGERWPQRVLLRRWRRELRRAGWRHRTDELFDGWLRTVVELGPDRRAVILLPLSFPAALPRYYAVLESPRRVIPFEPSGTPRLAPAAWRLALEQLERAHEAA
jgi:hypothetical protein